MTSSNVFSFYDAAEIAQTEVKNRVNTTDNACTTEEAEVNDVCDADSIQGDDVRDEADVIEGETEEERSSGAVNQWLDRANALNEIRLLLKEEIEQDSGEYFVCYIHAHVTFIFPILTSTIIRCKQPCFQSSMT